MWLCDVSMILSRYQEPGSSGRAFSTETFLLLWGILLLRPFFPTTSFSIVHAIHPWPHTNQTILALIRTTIEPNTMWKSLISSGRQAMRQNCHSHSAATLPRPTAIYRNFTVAPGLSKQSKDTRDFDREALDPHPSEATKTGTDDQIAQHDSAFDPSNISPEGELEATEREAQAKGKRGTLNVSGANKEANTWRGPQEGGPARNADKESTSKRGHPNKSRKIEVKEDGTHVSYR